MSLPWLMAANPAAPADAAPPEEPPGDACESQGFRVRPCSGLSVVSRIDISGVLVRPIRMAPAFSKFDTTGEWSGAMVSLNISIPLVVARPLVSTFTLTVTGTPCSGPSVLPSATAASAACAAVRADSSSKSTIALSCAFFCSIRPSAECTSSVAVNVRFFTPAACSTALSCHNGVIVSPCLVTALAQASSIMCRGRKRKPIPGRLSVI